MKTLRFTAGHLPGLAPAEVRWQTLAFEQGEIRLEVATPLLSPEQTTALAGRVRAAARAHLRPLRVSEIVAIVDRAVARLLDRDDPVRQELERLLPVVSGYDAETVRLALTTFFKTFRAPQLQRFLAEDFANPKLLDEFQPVPKGGAARAFGPDLLAHHWAGNVPALPLWSLVCGLLVKAGNVGKLPSAEPVFASVFARLLAEVHPPWAECLAVVWWKGGDRERAAALHGQADAVLAYGSNPALAELARELPVTTRFLPHGHKLGVGLVARSALDARQGPATARLAALEVARHDQQGCYSPHVFYVERGGRCSPREFAEHLAGELANLQIRFPRRRLELEEAASVAGWRHAGEWQGSASGTTELIGPEAAPWGVAYRGSLPPFGPTASHRSAEVVAVDALEPAIDALAAARPYLQTAGLAAAPDELFRLAARLGAAGVTRIAAIGSMTSPEAGWHHDGRFNLLDLVRMVEIEASAERAAEAFAPYAD